VKLPQPLGAADDGYAHGMVLVSRSQVGVLSLHLYCSNNSIIYQLATRKEIKMKKIVLFAIMIVLANVSSLNAQPQEDYSCSFQYEGYGAHDELFAVTEDNDYNSIVTGKVMHENEECDIFIGSFYGLPYPNWIYRYTGNMILPRFSGQ
jgi:hypothetical protein